MSKAETNKVSMQLVWAREQNIIPWEWIVDETREAERPNTLSFRRRSWSIVGLAEGYYTTARLPCASMSFRGAIQTDVGS